MKVSEIAKYLGVTADTVRFYTRINVLNPQKSQVNGYREYSEADVHRLRFVLSARQLEFSVDDIQQILSHSDKKKSPCPTVRRLIEKRLHETEQRFEEMVRLRDRMREAVREWSALPDREPDGNMVCHLIEKFTANFSEDSSS